MLRIVQELLASYHIISLKRNNRVSELQRFLCRFGLRGPIVSHLVCVLGCVPFSPAPDLRFNRVNLGSQGYQLVKRQGREQGGGDGNERKQENRPGQSPFACPFFSPGLLHAISRELHTGCMTGLRIKRHSPQLHYNPCQSAPLTSLTLTFVLSQQTTVQSEALRRKNTVQKRATASPLLFRSANRTHSFLPCQKPWQIFLPSHRISCPFIIISHPLAPSHFNK